MRLDSLRPTLKKGFGGMAVFLPVPIRDMKKPPPFLYEDLHGSS